MANLFPLTRDPTTGIAAALSEGADVLLLGSMDRETAGNIAIGAATATSIAIGAAGVTTAGIVLDAEASNISIRTATSGNVLVSAADNVDIDGGALISVGATNATTIALGAGVVTTGGITLNTEASNLGLYTNTSGDIVIYAADVIDIDAGTDVDIDATAGHFSLDAVTNSNITVTSAAFQTLTLSTVTSGSLILSAADALSIDADAAGGGGAPISIGTAGGTAVDIGAAVVTVGGITLNTEASDMFLTTNTSGDIIVGAATDVTIDSGNDIIIGPTTATTINIGAAGATTGGMTLDTEASHMELYTNTSGDIIINAADNLDIDADDIMVYSANDIDIDADNSIMITAVSGTLDIDADVITVDATTTIDISAVGAIGVGTPTVGVDLTLWGQGASITLNDAVNKVLVGYTATSIVGAFNEAAAGTVGPDLDQAYNLFGATEARIVVDQAEGQNPISVTWELHDQNNFVVDVSNGAGNGAAAGFIVQNGTDNVTIKHDGVNLLEWTAEVDTGVWNFSTSLGITGTTTFNSAAYFLDSARLNSDVGLYFGAAGNAQIEFDTAHQTVDSWQWGVDTAGQMILIQTLDDIAVDMNHPAQANPTIFLHSSDATDITQYLSVAHNQTDAAFGVGTGGFQFSGQVFTPPHTLTDGAVITPDWNDGNVQVVTLGGNRTLANGTNPKGNATYTVIVKQDGVGTRTLAYGAAYKWEGGVAPVLSTGVNDVDVLTFVYDSAASVYYGLIAQDFS